jgi:hypothetical protein
VGPPIESYIPTRSHSNNVHHAKASQPSDPNPFNPITSQLKLQVMLISPPLVAAFCSSNKKQATGIAAAITTTGSRHQEQTLWFIGGSNRQACSAHASSAKSSSRHLPFKDDAYKMTCMRMPEHHIPVCYYLLFSCSQPLLQ